MEDRVEPVREAFRLVVEQRRRLDEANREIRLVLEEALAAHRCDGFAGCWCVRGRAAITRLLEA